MKNAIVDCSLTPEVRLSPSAVSYLRERLANFYSDVPDYLVFQSMSWQTGCWNHVGQWIRSHQASQDREAEVRILEVGAGRSGFGKWLKAEGLRNRVNLVAQDVTELNRAWLEAEADEVIFDHVDQIPESMQFDAIVSTYVLEHVSNPKPHLAKLRSLLRPEGMLFIWCPRYDVPGYLCPSCRHLPWTKRVQIAFVCLMARIQALVCRRPSFLIQTDLAAFHGPFFIDCDASHWVSQIDLRLWAAEHGDLFESGSPETHASGLKDWIVKRWLTCAVTIRKAEVPRSI